MMVDVEDQRALVRHLFPMLRWSGHGYGFLRGALSEELHVHVWDSRLVVPGVHVVHDHRYDLVSTVLAGQIDHIEITPVPDPQGALGMFEAPDMRTDGARFRERRARVGFTFHRGNRYEFSKGLFHQTIPRGPAVTLVRKTNREPGSARVLAPFDWTLIGIDSSEQRAVTDAVLFQAKELLQ